MITTIGMEEIVRIKLSGYYNEEAVSLLRDFYSNIIQKAVDLELWDYSIKAIILTDHFLTDIAKQAEEWNVRTSISQEKDYSVASKILFNQNLDFPEYQIFLNFQILAQNPLHNEEITFGQIIGIYSKRIIPAYIRKQAMSHFPHTLEDCVKSVSIEWCSTFYRKSLEDRIRKSTIPPINPSNLLITFKRKLKKALYEYNSDGLDAQGRLIRFWDQYLSSIDVLFLRLIEIDLSEVIKEIKDNEICKTSLIKVINEIRCLTEKCLKGDTFDVIALKIAIREFSGNFHVFLEKETDDNFYINLPRDPKDYFVGEIVETEPRIICFMDILGFSDLIHDYETDLTSTVLQDIQESFALAKVQLLETTTLNNQDLLKHLSYQTFSDNICISIPYFDNEDDFLMNFNFISVFVRGFQQIMFSKRIFMRGGVSTGSYYADNNIIFSSGLIKAYHLESKTAIYPRVIIDKSIIERLRKYDRKKLSKFALDRAVILDWENVCFFNPFGLIDGSIQMLESAFNNLLEDTDDDPLIRSVLKLTQSINNVTLETLKSISDNEREEISKVKQFVLHNIYIYKDNERVLSKYLWLEQFIKWHEGDSTRKLEFRELSSILDKE
ncbi:hypothetical protein J2Y45_002296 [Dyadobacter sp. BE34]|uniref:Guanylate cyclase domain-containing protein n=1 Tax=Dyadobacter fermentans TaxID=94254 RepID=A0ABU1QW76_9BACT|nr:MULTISPECIES: hypothetical protein [Dyadobacter]MDR6805395.1 hypothetical protein [Dyadobacter fermentans]MDR7042845.1 hypothetical protein [Dyadobacter sp. BE242]MDR7197157.1 hypothetical protein [Dyadobacter sp. BE34]MDR7215408.1 hypothetical protein [Dyadobacter sp. BE31]MDR7262944.1 hypothetical protein [Dyadobacter sp. BE32]